MPKGLKVVRNNRQIVAQLYNTVIVTIENDKCTLNTGGWFTTHTKKCMNLVLGEFGLNVRQIKGEWFLSKKSEIIEKFEGSKIEFKIAS